MPAPSSLPTGTVTFLLTDVEGSTAAWQRAPEQMAVAMARHDALVDHAVIAHGGVRSVEPGDGGSVVAAFQRPSDAVAAALDAQRALQAEAWPEAAGLRVRMAVHTGEVVVRGERDYAGTTLHRCARLRACAHGGQVVVSRPTAELVVDRLPAGADLIDLGSHQLKDLVRPEQVYQLVHPDLAGDFPPLRSLDAHRHNLPYQTTPLIGRDDELAAIGAALDADRLVTLTGAAGIGKTRLAVHAAADRVERHPDGVAFVELATVNDPEAVASKVAGVLRVWETTTEPSLDSIARFVADRAVLLVLDNCEHVVDAAAELAVGLLGACPQLTILATSREPLGVLGEVAWRVPSLPSPAADQASGLLELSRFDAVRLFADRARRARPGFVLTDASAGPVAEICRRLDGIPLALELAAARCRAMAPHTIADQLDRRFVLLTGGARTALARQQTLLASVEWSHDLLGADERAVFRRLGTFTGPFPLEAADAICADAPDAGWGVFDVLSRLVDKSLVVHDPDSDWYRLLETIRLYAVDRCRDAGELEATRDRQAAWWTAWLGAHHPDAPSDGDLDTIHRAYPNLRAALQWAAATEPHAALELAGGLGIYWYLHGLLGDAVTLGDLALACAGRGAEWARAVGRMAMPRYYARDHTFMTTIVAEACAIADAAGDRLTPLRCAAARTMDIADLDEFRQLAHVADDCGDLWVAARMHLCVAGVGALLDQPDAPAALERLAAIAEQLDASSFRFTVDYLSAERLAANLQLGEAIACLEQVMHLVDRASPSVGLTAITNLAFYRLLSGEPAPFDRASSLLARAAGLGRGDGLGVGAATPARDLTCRRRTRWAGNGRHDVLAGHWPSRRRADRVVHGIRHRLPVGLRRPARRRPSDNDAPSRFPVIG